jgi:2-C-methyl-D-erythritol 4-phosphate cytidylyltransferase
MPIGGRGGFAGAAVLNRPEGKSHRLTAISQGANSLSVWAVLAAAGRGERLGGNRPKAFAKLRDRPLLAESLERLESSVWVDAIVIVAPPGWEEPSILVAEELACTKVVACASGGETRAESVRAGVAEVGDDAAVIAVHDAARPILPEEVLERVLTALNEGWDGAVPALPLADTIKRVQGGQIVETLPRDELFAAQTPQAFLAPVLREALAGDLAEATDCSALVEARGGRVTTVPGDRRLLKVTDQADLELVASFL